MRNKAAEKAKHVHQHQQPSATPPENSGGQADSNSGATNSGVAAAEQRLGGGYSINGILGIHGEKRKRQEHGKIKKKNLKN